MNNSPEFFSLWKSVEQSSVTEVQNALSQMDPEKRKKCLREVRLESPFGWTIFHRAVDKKNLKMVEIFKEALENQEIDTSRRTGGVWGSRHSYEMSLHIAARWPNTEVVSFLLNYYDPLELELQRGNNALGAALHDKQLNNALLILDKAIDSKRVKLVTHLNNNSENCLHLLVQNVEKSENALAKVVEKVNLLTDVKDLLNQYDIYGNPPFFYALSCSNESFIKEFFSLSDTKDSTSNFILHQNCNGNNCLHILCSKLESADRLEFFINQISPDNLKVLLEQKNQLRDDAFTVAISRGNSDIISFWLEFYLKNQEFVLSKNQCYAHQLVKLNVNLKLVFIKKLLQIAETRRDVESIFWGEDKNRKFPAVLAIENKQVDVLEIILKNEYSQACGRKHLKGFKNSDFQNVYHLAAKSENVKMIQLLNEFFSFQDTKELLKAKDKEGKTPGCYASQSNNNQINELLNYKQEHVEKKPPEPPQEKVKQNLREEKEVPEPVKVEQPIEVQSSDSVFESLREKNMTSFEESLINSFMCEYHIALLVKQNKVQIPNSSDEFVKLITQATANQPAFFGKESALLLALAPHLWAAYKQPVPRAQSTLNLLGNDTTLINDILKSVGSRIANLYKNQLVCLDPSAITNVLGPCAALRILNYFSSSSVGKKEHFKLKDEMVKGLILGKDDEYFNNPLRPQDKSTLEKIRNHIQVGQPEDFWTPVGVFTQPGLKVKGPEGEIVLETENRDSITYGYIELSEEEASKHFGYVKKTEKGSGTCITF